MEDIILRVYCQSFSKVITMDILWAESVGSIGHYPRAREGLRSDVNGQRVQHRIRTCTYRCRP